MGHRDKLSQKMAKMQSATLDSDDQSNAATKHILGKMNKNLDKFNDSIKQLEKQIKVLEPDFNKRCKF